MNPYIDPFKKIYNQLINNYQLNVNCIDYQSVSLYKENVFSLDFVCYQDTIGLLYVLPYSENMVIKYNITEYVINKAGESERKGIDIHYENLYELHIISLKIFANTLQNHFTNILNGDVSWIEDYKSSPYFINPSIEQKPND